MHKKALPEHEYIECEAKLEGCTGRATQWHHPEGRIGAKLIDEKNKKLVCANCHYRIETEPEMAKQKGLSKSRLNKQ